MDKNEKEIRTTDQPLSTQSYRQRSESAQSLGKLLTSIVKMFRLAQVSRKRDNSDDEEQDSVEYTIRSYWEESMLPSV